VKIYKNEQIQLKVIKGKVILVNIVQKYVMVF